MERFKNAQKTVTGIGYKSFMILRYTNTNEYRYYLRVVWFKDYVGNRFCIKIAKERVKILNRYTLPTLSFIMNLAIPFVIVLFLILHPFIRYINGGVNFFRDRSNITDIRFFSYTNLILLLIMSISLFILTIIIIH